jgi:hypothetical protein
MCLFQVAALFSAVNISTKQSSRTGQSFGNKIAIECPARGLLFVERLNEQQFATIHNQPGIFNQP